MQTAAPPAARALLVQVAHTPGAAKSAFDKLPWDAPDIQTYCSEALALTGDAAQSLPALIKALDDVAPSQGRDIARSMLQLVFAGKPMPAGTTVAELTEDQRTALTAIARSKIFWVGFGKKSNMANTMQLLQTFGLPDKPDDFRTFLGMRREWPLVERLNRYFRLGAGD